MDQAGGQRAHGHGVDADHLVLLVQHGDHEVFAVYGTKVLAEEDRRLPGTADLGLRVRHTALAHERDAVDEATVGPDVACLVVGEQAGLLW